MIGLIILMALGLWVAGAAVLSKRIPRWLSINKHTTAVSVLAFPLVLVAPFADELIGRWQFHRLCDREAVVTLSPDWRKVTRAVSRDIPTINLNWYAIPIRLQRDEYFDKSTGKTFLSIKSFHTKGGFVMRNGLGLGGTSSCRPPNTTDVMNKINIDDLIKRGK